MILTNVFNGSRRLIFYKKTLLLDIVENNTSADYVFDIISQNEVNVTVTTYKYELLAFGAVIGTYPEEPTKTAYSLHIYDPMIVNSTDVSKSANVILFPNPNTGIFNLQYELDKGRATAARIIDITGRIIWERLVTQPKIGEVNFHLSDMSSGVYICQLITDNDVIYKKFVKH